MSFFLIQQTHWQMNVKRFRLQYCRLPKKSLDQLRILQLYRQWYKKHRLTWNNLSYNIHTGGKALLTYSHTKSKKHASGKHGTW